MNESTYIERHILIGLIVSDEFLKTVHKNWDPEYLKSDIARQLSSWCIEYYHKYGSAPREDIKGIYFEKLKKGEISKEEAEELEEDILPNLSDEFERADTFNVRYLIDKAKEYFTERHLEIHHEHIEDLLETGNIEEAEAEAKSYSPLVGDLENDINLAHASSLERVRKAFTDQAKPILQYPGPLGEFLNPQLTRDAFVAFLAPEKRGKSFMMMDMARRAVRQRLNVAFFQAGDMSGAQQLRRIGIHLAKRSDREEYTGKQWQPVKDCVLNQTDQCDLEVRESFFGLDGEDAPQTIEAAKSGLTFQQLLDLYDYNDDYKPCHNCMKYKQKNHRLGTSWIKQVDTGPPLQAEEAVTIFEKYFVENHRQMRLATYPNGTLTIPIMETKLDDWYREGFVPDLIICDYAELLEATSKEYRHKQDEIWRGFRRISEQRHCLTVTATQADAQSYEQGLLSLKNFTEDKRKFAHVTAMYGLNQDPDGREKEIGIMRINALVERESDSSGVVYVLQNLKRGQPVLTSYF